MLQHPQSAALATVKDIQDDSEQTLHLRACVWQCKIALELLLRTKHYASTAATGSGKTLVFWLPMMYETGVTIIIVPLKILGEQLAKESSQAGFEAVNVTLENLGDSPGLIMVQ